MIDVSQAQAAGAAVPIEAASMGVDPRIAEMKRRVADAMIKYFARKPRAEVAAECMKKVSAYYDYTREIGRWGLWKRCYDNYYMGERTGGVISKVGEQDELSTMSANHFRNILEHIINQTTNQRPEYEPRAVNTDWDSQAQTYVARGVLDYYNREKHLDRHLKKGVEHATVYAEGFFMEGWDPKIGDDYMPDPDDPEGKDTLKTGDITFRNYAPNHVIREVGKLSDSSNTWYIVVDFKNKYDMAAKYPDLADQIVGLSIGDDERENFFFKRWEVTDSDDIAVYTLVHDRTPAVPEGRLVEFLSSTITTIDSPLPFDSMPLYRICPSDQEGTGFGYTIAFDLLPIQQAINALYSTVVTNQEQFGVQNIAMPKGGGVNVKQLLGGLNLVEYDPALGKPEALELLKTPAEIFNFIKQLETLMETISGVNSVVRGQPEASLESGAALALIASQAIQFNSGLQQAYAQLLEDSGTGIVKILQRYANVPRMALIAGKSNRSLMRAFSKKDIAKISRVVVDMGNPLSRTTSGKLTIADTLMDKGLIKTADEYLTVLNTGKLEPLYEGQTAQILLIRAENEALGEGQEAPVLATDDHRLHILEHQTVLASPEARRDPKVVATALNHIQEHIVQLKTADPVLLSLYGQPIVPPSPGGPPPPPSGGAPNGPTGGGMPPAVTSTENPVEAAADKVAMPSMPKNPGTGEQFNPEAGK